MGGRLEGKRIAFLTANEGVEQAELEQPWILIEADAVRGRTMTSWPSLQTDLRNAGATWVDEEVHVDRQLISSRKPDDLPAFCSELIDAVAAGPQPKRAEAGAPLAV